MGPTWGGFACRCQSDPKSHSILCCAKATPLNVLAVCDVCKQWIHQVALRFKEQLLCYVFKYLEVLKLSVLLRLRAEIISEPALGFKMGWLINQL